MLQGWVVPVCMTVILWGGMMFLPKIAVSTISPASAVLYEILGGLAIGIVVFCFLGGKIQFDPRGSSAAFLTGILGFSGTFAYFWAVTKGPVSVISVLTAMYPLIPLFFGVVFLHEELSFRQIVGIVAALIGVVLISGK